MKKLSHFMIENIQKHFAQKDIKYKELKVHFGKFYHFPKHITKEVIHHLVKQKFLIKKGTNKQPIFEVNISLIEEVEVHAQD